VNKIVGDWFEPVSFKFFNYPITTTRTSVTPLTSPKFNVISFAFLISTSTLTKSLPALIE
jgi:hypothetical protein